MSGIEVVTLEGRARFELARARRALKRWRRNRRNARDRAFRDFDPVTVETIRRVAPFTQTSWQKLHGLIRATEYLVENEIPGAFVECGVYRGGSMLAVALTLERLAAQDRELFLYDTFDGMPEPATRDVALETGRAAFDTWRRFGGHAGGSAWCRADLDTVRATLARSSHPPERIHLVAGKVEDTLPERAPAEVALLRLDTDWYASTRHELVHLFPRLRSGGVLIVDDYGTWAGARQAVDAYLREHGIPLLLNRLDAGARIAVKLR